MQANEKEKVLPRANAFCYGQVESPYGSGQFIKDLREVFASSEQVLTSEIPNKDAIYKSIKDFLGRGKCTRPPKAVTIYAATACIQAAGSSSSSRRAG